jgi:uncharacterized protein involved in exopolysaccharide biosynthesis
MLDSATAVKPHEGLLTGGPIALRDILNSVFYYGRTAFAIALTVLVLGTLAAVLIPPSYTARARLLTLNASVYDMQPGTTATAPTQDPTAAVNTEMQLLDSPELHRSIVQTELGPTATPAALNRRVREFEAHLHITKVEAANVIELEYSDRDPELAGYFKQRADVLTSGRVDFLSGQRDTVRAQLAQANAQIAAYEKSNGVVDVDEQVKGAVGLDDTLHEHKQEADAAVADGQKSVMVLLNDAKDVPTQVELSSDNTEAARTMGTMEVNLLELEAKRADLAARYMPGSPFVTHVEAQIAEVKKAMAAQQKDLVAEHRTGYNNRHDTTQDRLIEAEANLAGAKARQAELNREIAASSGHLKSLISVSDTLTQLRAQRDLLAQTDKNYSEQLEQARIQQNQATTAGTTNVRVIESPVAPTRRNNPPLLLIAASFVSAIAISAILVFILSSLRETFLSPQEAERGLALPVVCVLPKEGAARSQLGRMISTINAHSSSGPFSGPGKVVLLLTPQSRSELDSMVQLLVAALERRSPGRVALLQLEEGSGARREGRPAVIPVNGVPTGSVDSAISREHLMNIVGELRTEYEYVIMTAPPAASSFESVEATTAADLIFLIVKAEETRRPVAQAILTQVSEMNATVNGIVLTGRQYHIPAWIYGMALGRKLATP